MKLRAPFVPIFAVAIGCMAPGSGGPRPGAPVVASDGRLAMGTAFVRVVAPLDTDQVAPRLREEGFPVTVINAHGRDGEVRLSFMVMPRKKIKQALATVREINPEAFVTVEEVNLPDLERLRRSSTVRK